MNKRIFYEKYRNIFLGGAGTASLFLLGAFGSANSIFRLFVRNIQGDNPFGEFKNKKGKKYKFKINWKSIKF